MSRFLGIDATKTTVRTAIIRTSYRRITIESLGEADVSACGSEVLALRSAVGTERADASAIALSGERSFYRRLELPAAAQKEVASILPFELEANMPFEMEDAIFDYRLLKRAPGEASLPVFAVVARTDEVRERIALVREALGQEPERIGTGAVPLSNLISVMPELERSAFPVASVPLPLPLPGMPVEPGPPAPPTGERIVGVLDVGEITSDLVLLQGGEAVFARTLSRGTKGLPASAPMLARELRQTLASWKSMGGAPLAGIYLVGGGASTQGAEAFFAGELGLEVRQLPTPRFDGLSPEQASVLPRFAKALGLALGLMGRSRAFNLRRGALEAERRYPFLREKIPLLAGLGSVILVSVGFSVVVQMRSLDADYEMLSAELASASREVLGEETTDPEHARELLEAGPGAEEDPMPHADAFDVMVQLSKAVLPEVVHDVVELDVARGHVNILGTVPTIPDAQPIAEKMKEHRCFKDVKVPRTTQYGEGKQKYTLEFDIKCGEKKKKTPEEASSAAPSAAKPETPR